MEKIKLGISTCLLGENVRYDGGHKLDRFLTSTLGQFVDYVPVCPEVECGLTIPREAMHLVGDPEKPRLVTIRSNKDYTEQMTAWGRKRVRELEDKELCGFIFKSKSPSSGMARVKVYNQEKGGQPQHNGVGIWASIFMEHFPNLPVEEDGRLHDTGLRENFLDRVFLFKRWRDMEARGKTLGNLVDFHSRHKLQIMSHSPEIYRNMGKLVAEGKKHNVSELFSSYLRLLLKAMSLKSTIKKNRNVLLHLLGYFKKDLSGDEKKELIEIIDNFASGLVPLIVPVTLVNHYVRKYDQPYLKTQYYLNPSPLELKLRNHV